MEQTPVYTRPERRGIDPRQLRLNHISLQLAAMGHRCDLHEGHHFLSIADSLLKNYSQHRRLLADYRCPADRRIQDFLCAYLQRNGIEEPVSLPGETFILNQRGLARELSLPLNENAYYSERVESYRTTRGTAQSPQRSAHHEGRVPHCRRRPARPFRQARRAGDGLRETSAGGVASARRVDGAAA